MFFFSLHRGESIISCNLFQRSNYLTLLSNFILLTFFFIFSLSRRPYRRRWDESFFLIYESSSLRIKMIRNSEITRHFSTYIFNTKLLNYVSIKKQILRFSSTKKYFSTILRYQIKLIESSQKIVWKTIPFNCLNN